MKKALTAAATARITISKAGGGLSPLPDSSNSPITIVRPACRANSSRGSQRCGVNPWPSRATVADVPIAELAWLALAVSLGGIVSGILAGLFGIGGGAIIVPVLYEVFGLLNVADAVRMQLCIGTSIAIIVPTTYWSYRAHRAKGAV